MGVFGISKRQRETELLQALHERDHWRAVALGVPGESKIELSDEAVEAAKKAFEDLPNGIVLSEPLGRIPDYGDTIQSRDIARTMLVAALPFLATKGNDHAQQ